MRALEIITGHVIYNPVYTYKFQLKTTIYGLPHYYLYFLPLLSSHTETKLGSITPNTHDKPYFHPEARTELCTAYNRVRNVS